MESPSDPAGSCANYSEATPALGAGTTTQTTAVAVTATEFKFKLSKSSVPHGKLVFTLVNKGKLAHDFWIGGKTSPLVQPGRRAKLTLTLSAGKLLYLCTVPGHSAAGMKGTLTVR
jgi:uncharacterized cupredoxin-like copper-binding protein